MTTHIAVLRAINVAGRNLVGMTELRGLVEGLGFEAVQTVLQTGNLVFRGRAMDREELEKILEDAAGTELGLKTGVLVRTPREWRSVLSKNPMPDVADRDPSHYIVAFLKDTQGKGQGSALRGVIQGGEVVYVDGRHVYIYYPDGMGRSKLTMTRVERTLGTRGTARNWNTVLRVAGLVED